MRTVLLLLGVNLIAVNKHINIKVIDIINRFSYNIIFLLHFIVLFSIFYIIHSRITYAATFTNILS
jgi:hypothetical protein